MGLFYQDFQIIIRGERNEEREGLRYVPPSAIKRMYSQYEPPELEEGFDDILIAI